MKKWRSIKDKLYAPIFGVVFVIVWQIVAKSGIVPRFMLPAPTDVVLALMSDWKLILESAYVTLSEAAIGLVLSIILSFAMAILMDRVEILHKIFYPIAIVSQTIPTVAIAPLMVLWFGFGMLPKILLVWLACFFPLLVALLTGFESSDKNVLRLYRSMNAPYIKVLFDVKIPYALDSFFSGLRISASYSIVGAVIAEWLGGEGGLGVYMTRVRKSYRFDKMFAVIIVVSILSLLLIWLVDTIKRKSMPWKKYEKG